MSNTKVSIIIPIYNVGKYLEKCLESVLSQTLRDIEIICVNDGSTDNSLNIVNKYASVDSRITVVNIDNSGVAAARNIGLQIAKSKYVMFVDGDDYLLPEACETAVNSIESNNADISVFGSYNLENGELIKGWTSKKIEEFLVNDSLNDYFEFQIFVWDKIFRLDFLKKYKFKFIEGLKTAEDVLFCLMTYFFHPRYCLINKPLYVYRVGRFDSSTNNKNCIASDFISFKVLYEKDIFRAQSLKAQLRIIDKFFKASIGYLKKSSNGRTCLVDVNNFVKFLDDRYPINALKTLKSYKILKYFKSARVIIQICPINVLSSNLCKILGLNIC